MRQLMTLLGFIVTVFLCNAQQPKEVRRFSTLDGLPSDHIYKCATDNQGFLWVATTAGIARFDGKHFQVFTTDDGLPDNEVLEVVKEKNGTIWVNCFNHIPAYFDIVKNRFITVNEEGKLNDVKTSPSSLLFPLPINGVYFSAGGQPNHHYLLSDRSCYKLQMPKKKYDMQPLKIFPDTSYLVLCWKIHFDNTETLCHIKNGKILKESPAQFKMDKVYSLSDLIEGKKFFLLYKQNRVIIYSNFNLQKGVMKIDTLKLFGKLDNFRTTSNYYISITKQGAIEGYNKNTMQLSFSLHGNFIANEIYIDHHENYWLSSIDKGLLLYKNQTITNADIPLKYKNDAFLSIAKTKDGDLFAGNFAGEVLYINKNKIYKKSKLENEINLWVRSIIYSNDKLFAFTEKGTFVDLTRKRKLTVKTGESGIYQVKNAIKFNDSLFIAGGIIGLMKINARTEQLSLLNSRTRVTSIATIDHKDIVYFGSTNGLFKYSYLKDTTLSLHAADKLLHERIVSLCATSEKLLWIATANNGIVVLNDDKVIAHFTKASGLLSNTSNTIAIGKYGQVWIGSNEGISIINYKALKDSITTNSIQNLTIQDGLTSNVINQMCFENDTIYAATSNGISVIPAIISIPKFDIPIYLTNLQINQKDTSLLTYYNLGSNQNNINFQFAGVELTGHFKNAHLSLDNGESWANIEGTSLSLQLGSGEHFIWLRAVDVNGNIGNKILKLQFDIDTPFYKTWWFGVIISIFIIITSILYYSRYIRKKHERKIDKLLDKQLLDEFEIQALKAQINPHFIFNCLNSIKGFIQLEDYEKADLYLDEFSQLLRNTLSYSSQSTISLRAEIEYISTYLLLEKLRFGNKFNYNINIMEGLTPDEINLPAMLLQPYVENAVKHGVCNQKGNNGIIQIKVYLVKDVLHVEIDDNGVGRERAMLIKQHQQLEYESKGTQLTQRRLELYKIDIEVIDKKNQNGEASGTLIHLKLPLEKP